MSPFQHGTNRSNRFASKSTIFWRKSDRLLQSGLHRQWKPRWPSEHSHSTLNLPGCSLVLSSPHLALRWRKKLSTLNITPLFVLPCGMCFNNFCHKCYIRVETCFLFYFIQLDYWGRQLIREVTSGVPAHSSDFNFYTAKSVTSSIYSDYACGWHLSKQR